jgi:hypothetical protein
VGGQRSQVTAAFGREGRRFSFSELLLFKPPCPMDAPDEQLLIAARVRARRWERRRSGWAASFPARSLFEFLVKNPQFVTTPRWSLRSSALYIWHCKNKCRPDPGNPPFVFEPNARRRALSEAKLESP